MVRFQVSNIFLTRLLCSVYTRCNMTVNRKQFVPVAREAFESCACFRARQKAREITRAYDDALRPVELRITQFTMLSAILSVNGSLNITELAKLLVMDRTTFSRNLGPLSRRKIVRYTDEQPGRDRSVLITDEGLSLYSKAVPLWRKVQRKYNVS